MKNVLLLTIPLLFLCSLLTANHQNQNPVTVEITHPSVLDNMDMLGEIEQKYESLDFVLDVNFINNNREVEIEFEANTTQEQKDDIIRDFNIEWDN